MKKLLFVCILFAFFFEKMAAQTWETLSAPAANRYDDVFFLPDNLTGWACNSYGLILQTKDGGANWQQQFDATGYLRSIEFLDKNLGFCGGLNAGNYLFKTVDGGQKWENVTNQLPGLKGICGFSAPDDKTIYGVGAWTGPAYVIKSTNGSGVFTKHDMSAYASRLVDAYFVTADSGFISGTAKDPSDGGIILSTSDGGTTWHTKILTGVKDDYVWKLQSPDGKHLFASIERTGPQTLKTEILKSSDFGQTWGKKKVDSQLHRLQMIGFLDSLNGFTGDDALFKTIDGGENWSNVSFPFSTSFDRFHRLDGQTAVVTGSNLYRLNWMTTATESPVLPIKKYRVLQLHGNPATQGSSIVLDLEKPSFTRLWICPVDGKQADKPVFSGELGSGEHRFSIPDGLEKGSYFVFIKTNYGTEDALLEVF